MTREQPLAVLVVGTDDWAVSQARDSLVAAGQVGLTCHEPGEQAFPCNALREGRTCPLEAGAKVALVVRARPLPEPAPGEIGALCALRARLPMVAAGMSSSNPFAPFAEVEVANNGDLLQACRSAAESRIELIADLTEKALG